MAVLQLAEKDYGEQFLKGRASLASKILAQQGARLIRFLFLPAES